MIQQFKLSLSQCEARSVKITGDKNNCFALKQKQAFHLVFMYDVMLFV